MPVIDAKTRLVTLLGYPLGHSLSPYIHNAAFRAQEINMVYLCMPVPPDSLKMAVDGLYAARFVGSNVTIPHKEAIYSMVDELSERARAVRAVNTVVCRYGDDGRQLGLYGDNTDVFGFLKPLELYAGELRGGSFVVLGSGGSARAIVYALLTALKPGRLIIAARTTEKADRLAKDMSSYDESGALEVVPVHEAGSHIRSSRLVVNTTPLGMHPHETASPWLEPADFSSDHVVYDLIYNPRITRLLEDARSAGAKIIGGLEMLIYQAAASYEQWTNREMPIPVVRNVLESY